jgi:hypothetical protein
MKYVIELSGKRVLLSHDQLTAITKVIAGADILARKYTSEKQSDGSNYIPYIETPLIHDWFSTTVIEDNFIDALKLAAKLQDK